MRSRLALGVLLLGLALGTPAGASVGLHGGLNLASSSQTGSSSQTKFLFGGFAEFSVMAALYFRPEFNIVKYGPDLSYFGIPVLFELRSPVGKGVHVYVPAGLGLNFNSSEPSGVDYKSLFLSVMLAGGCEIEMSDALSLTAEIRYEHGLTDIHDGTGIPGGGFSARAFQLLAGLRFDL